MYLAPGKTSNHQNCYGVEASMSHAGSKEASNRVWIPCLERRRGLVSPKSMVFPRTSKPFSNNSTLIRDQANHANQAAHRGEPDKSAPRKALCLIIVHRRVRVDLLTSSPPTKESRRIPPSPSSPPPNTPNELSERSSTVATTYRASRRLY